MSARRRLAGLTLILTVIFLFLAMGLLLWEPRLGLQRVADYFDAFLLAEALQSRVWLVNSLAHLSLGLVLPFFGHFWRSSFPADGPVFAVSLVGAPLFLLLGGAGLAGYQMSYILALQTNTLDAVLTGLMVVRAAALVAASVAFGWMVLTITYLSWRSGALPVWMHAVGLATALATAATILVPLPLPLIFGLWSLLLAWQLYRRSK